MADESTGKQFKRQLVLLEQLKEIQTKCSHTLVFASNNVIFCSECNAVWIK